jgi:hypothetical protein
MRILNLPPKLVYEICERKLQATPFLVVGGGSMMK